VTLRHDPAFQTRGCPMSTTHIAGVGIDALRADLDALHGTGG
jgi:hypothetical protein